MKLKNYQVIGVNIKDDVIYYIDYECNNYDPKCDFENLVKEYWIN